MRRGPGSRSPVSVRVCLALAVVAVGLVGVHSGAARVVDSQLSSATNPLTLRHGAMGRSLRPNRAGAAQSVITGSLTANGAPFVLTIPAAGDTGSGTLSGTA